VRNLAGTRGREWLSRFEGSRRTISLTPRAKSLSGAALDVTQPFNAKEEAQAIYAALDGAGGKWSGVRQLADEASRRVFAQAIHEAAREFSPNRADEFFVRAYASILRARTEIGPEVKRYLSK